MLKILKADFRKFFAGKLFIVMAVLSVVFPLFSAGLYRLVLRNAQIPISINAETAFYGSFSPLNNYGLMLMIFMIIILLADFNQNTIRNKIVAGYSKTTVYLAGSVFTLSIACIATSIHAILTYFLTKHLVASTGEAFTVILRHLGVALLGTMAVYAFLQFLVFTFKSFGPALGILLGALLLTTMVFYALTVRIEMEVLEIVLIFLPSLQLSGNLAFKASLIPWMVLANIAYTALLVGLGLYLNKRLDYK
jgi:hypothetical protein